MSRTANVDSLKSHRDGQEDIPTSSLIWQQLASCTNGPSSKPRKAVPTDARRRRPYRLVRQEESAVFRMQTRLKLHMEAWAPLLEARLPLWPVLELVMSCAISSNEMKAPVPAPARAAQPSRTASSKSRQGSTQSTSPLDSSLRCFLLSASSMASLPRAGGSESAPTPRSSVHASARASNALSSAQTLSSKFSHSAARCLAVKTSPARGNCLVELVEERSHR